MSFLNKYHNYELHPEIKIEGFETSAWEGKEKIVQELKNRIAELSKQNQNRCMLRLLPWRRKRRIITARKDIKSYTHF